MNLLAIDTSTEACSCALALGDDISERYELAPRRHGELVLPMIEDLLAQAQLRLADLDGLAFGRGPGAFTGVRVGAGVVQGLALGAGLQVAPVSTLAAMAHSAFSESGAKKVLSAIDARMGEIYYAAWEIDDSGVPQLRVDEQVTRPELAPLPEGANWFGVGTGWDTYGDALTTHFGDQLSGFTGQRFPRAADIAWLGLQMFAAGQAVDAAEAVPVYLRDNVANKPGQR